MYLEPQLFCQYPITSTSHPQNQNKIQARMKEIWRKPQHLVLPTSAPQIKVIAQKIERRY